MHFFSSSGMILILGRSVRASFYHQFLMDFIGEMDVLGRRGRRGNFRACPGCSRRKSHMEEIYEVLRFIEHGAHCRQSMDCIRGTPLIRYLKDDPRIGKGRLFKWFRQLCVCLDQYHRCRNWKEYRYLNPYSVIVSEEGELLLLDLEAPENAFVMKQMQRRAIRDHFVKPVCRIGAGKDQKADLFAYGKTIQFLLAYTEIVPALTRWEETRLSRVISRCTGESKRGYEDIAHVLKALPAAKLKDPEPGAAQRKKLLAAACVCVLACAILKLGTSLTADERESAVTGSIQVRKEIPAQLAVSETPVLETLADEEILEAAGSVLKEYISGGSESELRAGLALGRRAELYIVRCLAEMYEKLDMEKEAAEAYGRLIQIETDQERIEAAEQSRMKLEPGREEDRENADAGVEEEDGETVSVDAETEEMP